MKRRAGVPIWLKSTARFLRHATSALNTKSASTRPSLQHVTASSTMNSLAVERTPAATGATIKTFVFLHLSSVAAATSLLKSTSTTPRLTTEQPSATSRLLLVDFVQISKLVESTINLATVTLLLKTNVPPHRSLQFLQNVDTAQTSPFALRRQSTASAWHFQNLNRALPLVNADGA